MLGAGEYSVIRTVISDDPFETMYDTLLYVSISRFVWHSGGKISAKDLSKSVEICSARMVAFAGLGNDTSPVSDRTMNTSNCNQCNESRCWEEVLDVATR